VLKFLKGKEEGLGKEAIKKGHELMLMPPWTAFEG
jgi:hypothetical protein